MNPEQWTAVDRYFAERLLPTDEVLDAALQASREAGLPQINVSPVQGKLLMLFAQMCGARRILEIGTLGGYSTLWLARALPADGELITLELDPKHADVARANFARAGLADRIELRLGTALESLNQLTAENTIPFDLIFIDADKANMSAYFDFAMKLSRPGTLIIADNVVRKGAVTDPSSDDVNVQGARRFIERLSTDPRITATALQTVGCKGYDGFALARVLADA